MGRHKAYLYVSAAVLEHFVYCLNGLLDAV